ncbi:trimethylguanosine synthase isoform X2 [Aricia agestis]|uniref:trimethylguanosine synthase isoform X2 n=1 Tax=Aricia agestis TaxID=91739 RepID=UPI001C205E17|nr:trimethylguanosine synthase isoform X2 [Aricia agestis]
MSDCYDSYHRWEPLAEFHFNLNNPENEELYRENYIYCLCSRVLTREVVKTYESEKYGSESDAEEVQDVVSSELDDHSHVHFSLDTSNKNKCDDEVASCYCSASHTDNYCSTDEHEPGQIHASHALQPSDSGADLTYQDYHLDITQDKLEELDEDVTKLDTYEDYLSEETWDKFWAIHGERLIWASWIKKYSDYINPDYLDENNDILLDENSVPQKLEKAEESQKSNENRRERKYSYDSKINPVMGSKDDITGKPSKNKSDTKDDSWVPIGRRRSISEHERIVSPKTLAATDSMTNVTKATLSSYNVTSSHVTSDSTPTDGYSISSSTSDDQFNDQTRIANVEDQTDEVTEELDNDQYWQLLWKKHFGEQYAIHYAYYVECHNHHDQFNELSNNKDKVLDNKLEELKLENDCENSDGNSQDAQTIVEIQEEKEQKKAKSGKSNENRTGKSKSRKKHEHKVINSVGALLQLLKEQQEKESELVDASEEKSTEKVETAITPDSTMNQDTIQNPQSRNSNSSHIDEDDDNNDPPEERYSSLKRSHELDADELMSERIKSTLDVMGFSLDPTKLPKGELIYKKRIGKLRPPRNKKWNAPRKIYFDDDGNPYHEKTDDEGHNSEIDTDKVDETNVKAEEKKPETSAEDELDDSNIVEAKEETQSEDISDQGNKDATVENPSQTKRRKRQKRHRPDTDTSELPAELQGHPKMMKYWKKRHSLFHRFDEGIRLDMESWFSVTPENVAAHIADRCARDTVLDAFCGAGGNSVQFARTCKRVIAIDIDPKKIELARHNALVYGVDNIEFIVGDFFEIGPTIKADLVFLSPPWGGPKYSENSEYDIETMLEPKPASELINVASTINSNIAIYLPRNSKTDQILSLAQEMGSSVEIEQSFLDRRFVAITAYFY